MYSYLFLHNDIYITQTDKKHTQKLHWLQILCFKHAVNY